MYKVIKSFGALAALAATATAHGLTNGVTIDGKYIGGFKLDYYYAKQYGGKIPEHIGWYAENLDNGFVEPNAFGTADIICHKNASPQGSSDSMAKVAAGGKVEFHWTPWPDTHIGPVMTYVAPYTGDIASVDKTQLKWTKIQEDGYSNGAWASITMIKQNSTWPVTVPSNLAAGKYVFRHEIISVHSAGTANGAQNYPQCLNIEVTGSGTAKPGNGVVGTKLYAVNDVIFNAYVSNIGYKIPGPKLWDGVGSGGSPSAPSTPYTPTTPSDKPSSSPAPSPSPIALVAPSAPSNGPDDNTGALPKEFTIQTLIKWLESKASESSRKARRHSRAFV